MSGMQLVRYDAMVSAARSRRGFVYCVQNLDTHACKIGWALNPPARIRALRTGNDDELALVGFFPGTRRIEALLHRWLKERRVRGEWFGDNDGDLPAWFSRLEQERWHVAYRDSRSGK